MYDWIKVLRRLQKVDPNAYFDIANTLISQFSVVEPSAYSCTGKRACSLTKFLCFKLNDSLLIVS